MQKLTLSADDQLYAMLHNQIGRGSIGRFISDAICPHWRSQEESKAVTAFGGLSHFSKAVNAVNGVNADQAAQAKRRYLDQRHTAKNAGLSDMLTIDTNSLLRHVLNDNAKLSAKAKAKAKEIIEGNTCYVALLALA